MPTDDLDVLREWDEPSETESKALRGVSTAVAAIRLRQVINEAHSFYTAAIGQPTDVHHWIMGDDGLIRRPRKAANTRSKPGSSRSLTTSVAIARCRTIVIR